MKARLVYAALAAALFIFPSMPARATCVIAPDGKSINVVTDNGASDEKSCEVSCKVDTKIGVVSVGCGGGGAADAAPAAAAPAAVAKADGFTCRISPDGKTVDAMIANPYKSETSCQIDCKVSTTQAGTTMSVSCSNQAAAGVGQVVLCSHVVAEGRAVKMLSGKGDCTRPLEERTDSEKATDKAADDAESERLANLPMPKPIAANKADEEELKAIGDDPEKIQEFFQKKMDAAMRKIPE